MQDRLQPLLSAVQRNCHIADARHAGDYTLCVYLLKMREYFRWEKGYAFQDNLPDEDLGDWLKQREHFWQTIEDESFADLPVDGDRYDPFDIEAVNAALNPYGLVYSGGLGGNCAPHFFLGKLGNLEKQTDMTILVSEDEYARDLTAPPAMSRNGTIFIRRESLRRMIWEKIEEWQWDKRDNAMGRAMRCFDFDNNPEAALEAMTDAVVDSVLFHEKGEVLAGKRLGPEWEQMLAAVSRSKAEFMIRAVRDHLADSLTTLPQLLREGDDASLHFFFANLTNMRKYLFPSLTRAYEDWVAGGKRETIDELLTASKNHWSGLAEQMLDVYRDNPDNFAKRLQVLVEASKL
ncbi:MAG: hypothetical protein JSU67_07440 [Gammaproteobacteria bacterium]|nr:MAG: hypothetical protein EP300_06815 [Gammaproteobacteria bacterium]UCH41488.1 MAG: hypothetical protein JSU67_07440 [Gammaproteobacteria bacterium]